MTLAITTVSIATLACVYATAAQEIAAPPTYEQNGEVPPEVSESYYQRFYDLHERITPIVHDVEVGEASSGLQFAPGVSAEAFMDPFAIMLRFRLTAGLIRMEDEYAKCLLRKRIDNGEALAPVVEANRQCDPTGGIHCSMALSNATSFCDDLEGMDCPRWAPSCERNRANAVDICQQAAFCQFSCCEDGCTGSECIRRVELGKKGRKCDDRCG